MSKKLLQWAIECSEGAVERGGQAGVVTAATGVGGVAATAGAGIYGCLENTGSLEKASEEVERFFRRQGDRAVEMAEDAIEDIVGWLGGKKRKKNRKRPSPPRLDQALAMLLSHLVYRGGSSNGMAPYQFEVKNKGKKGWKVLSAAWPLNPSVITTIWGDDFIRVHPDEAYNALATMWSKMPERWPPGVRLTMAIKRVGDAYRVRDADTPHENMDDFITRWPVFPQTGGPMRRGQFTGDEQDQGERETQAAFTSKESTWMQTAWNKLRGAAEWLLNREETSV